MTPGVDGGRKPEETKLAGSAVRWEIAAKVASVSASASCSLAVTTSNPRVQSLPGRLMPRRRLVAPRR